MDRDASTTLYYGETNGVGSLGREGIGIGAVSSNASLYQYYPPIRNR